MKFMLYSPDQAYHEALCVNVEIGGRSSRLLDSMERFDVFCVTFDLIPEILNLRKTF
jgi:hypothetical protein